MTKFLLSLILIGVTSLSWSQDSRQEKLENRKAEILKEIKENQVLLQSLKRKGRSAITILKIQEEKIALKEKLISTTEKQTEFLKIDIQKNSSKLNRLKHELLVLKEDYARMIIKSYKSRSEQSRAMFILSSESFLQAYKRAQYMKQYANFRKMQGEEIQSKSLALSQFNQKLNLQKDYKQKLIEEKEQERLSLQKEQQEQQALLEEIKKDETKISKDLKKKILESRMIDRQINRLIRLAIAEANRKVAAEKAKAIAAAKERKAKATNALGSNRLIEKESVRSEEAPEPISSTKIELTPESRILSENFNANKGRLPFPVEKGYVSLGYGDQQHPVFKSLMIHNSGVEITTEQGANARAVFEGEVSSVMVLSPVNKAVMIQHGEYFTVYQNLSSVSVNKGEKVSRKQPIGKIRTNGEKKTIIKFLILQNTTYANPTQWLSN